MYAAAAVDTVMKPIELFELRPTVKADENGFIQTIIVNIQILIPQVLQAKWEPVFTEAGQQALLALNRAGTIPAQHVMKLDQFFDAKGQPIRSVHDLTCNGYANPDSATGIAYGAFDLTGHFIKVQSALVEMEGLRYEMPYTRETRVITLDGGSAPTLTLADGTGKVLALINEHALRQYQFDNTGNLMASPPVETPSRPSRI